MTALDEFLHAASAEISRRAALATDPILVEGARVFQRAVSSTAAQAVELTEIGALNMLASVDTAAAINPHVAVMAIQAAAEIPWIPTPRMDQDDGSQVGLGLIDAVRDFGDVVCGMMLLTPGASYPLHNHAPQEVYLPITGTGQWRYGGAEDFVQLGPDTLVYNNPNDLHSAIAAESPELALYFLWP